MIPTNFTAMIHDSWFRHDSASSTPRFCLCVKTSLYVRNHSYENEFHLHVHFHANQTHFHLNGFERGLVLKMRQRATRKWPIVFTKAVTQKPPVKPGTVKAVTTARFRKNTPRWKNPISSLQAELKELQKQQEKQKCGLGNFLAVKKLSQNEFFLCYTPSTALTELTQIYQPSEARQRSASVKTCIEEWIPQWKSEESDLQLPIIAEQYHYANVAAYLPAQINFSPELIPIFENGKRHFKSFAEFSVIRLKLIALW